MRDWLIGLAAFALMLALVVGVGAPRHAEWVETNYGAEVSP